MIETMSSVISIQNTSKKDTIPWVEKYRPNKFDDIVLDSYNRKIFTNILEKNYFPNLLFYGPPGTGKTTTIINLIQEYQMKNNKKNKGMMIHLNASDERGIDIIRNQINQFVRSKNLFDSGLKFVILDEVDYMTKNAQQALKYLLQNCKYNVRFFLICNYISKIENSLQNEFICIRFNQLPEKDIFNFIKNISEKENLHLTDTSIQTIQKIYKSDIRSMINYIQLNQNITAVDWEQKTIHPSIFIIIHNYLLDTSKNIAEIIQYIHQISSQYNIDKKQIIKDYLDHIANFRENLIGQTNDVCNTTLNLITEKNIKQFLDIVEIIIHNNEASIDILLEYVCIQIRKFFIQV